MIELFDVEDGKVLPSKHCYTIDWLKVLMKEHPDHYMKMYAYIFYMTCYGKTNPYFNGKEGIKEQTIIEIMSRLDLQDEAISERVESKEYQSLVRKTFREWSGAESREKREYIRNILSNAAATQVSSDDVVRLFIDWINQYSEMHFQVIGAV